MARSNFFTTTSSLLALTAAALLLVGSPYYTNASITSCNTVYNALLPCLSYVTGSGDPSPQCCGGVRGLLASAGATSDRRMACNCIENLAGSAPPAYVPRAITLPAKCKVNLPFKIAPKVDCSKIN